MFVTREAIVIDHECQTPPPYTCGKGTIWRCDDIKGFMGKVLYRGCGQHWKAVTEPGRVSGPGNTANAWTKIDWPPTPPRGPSGTPLGKS